MQVKKITLSGFRYLRRMIRYYIYTARYRLLNIKLVDPVEFKCNICGVKNKVNRNYLSREVASCFSCGSTVRMRSIVHMLSIELFGESRELKNIPQNKSIKGIGMSDWLVGLRTYFARQVRLYKYLLSQKTYARYYINSRE